MKVFRKIFNKTKIKKEGNKSENLAVYNINEWV